MKKVLLVLLMVLMTVGLIVSCDDTKIVYKDNEKYDFIGYMMKDDSWFDSFKSIKPDLKKSGVTSITFTSDTSICNGLSWTDLTIENTGLVKGYVSGTDIFIVGEKIYGFYDCSDMFQGYTSLTSLDLSNFDTSHVETMYYMFKYCSSLTDLYLTNWNTSNVTDIDGMFDNCSSLTTLDLSSFDTSKVDCMNSIFLGCTSLTDLNIKQFTSCSDMENMFGTYSTTPTDNTGCISLNKVFINTSNTDIKTKLDSGTGKTWTWSDREYTHN